jgi:hypothetical protein
MRKRKVLRPFKVVDQFGAPLHTVMPSAHTQSHLLNLPTELRLMILNHLVSWNSVQDRLTALKDDTASRADFMHKLSPRIYADSRLDSLNPLLQVNRRIAMESCSILFQKTLELPFYLFLGLDDMGLAPFVQLLIKSIKQKLLAISLLFPHSSLTLNICFRITTWSSNFARGEELAALMKWLRFWAAGLRSMVTFKVRTLNERVLESMERHGLSDVDVMQQQNEDIVFVQREFLHVLEGAALVLATHLR